MNDETKQIADSFRCKYTVFEKGTDPDLVEQAYLKAYELGKKEGFCPAIVCLNEYVGPLLQEMERKDITFRMRLPNVRTTARKFWRNVSRNIQNVLMKMSS